MCRAGRYLFIHGAVAGVNKCIQTVLGDDAGNLLDIRKLNRLLAPQAAHGQAKGGYCRRGALDAGTQGKAHGMIVSFIPSSRTGMPIAAA